MDSGNSFNLCTPESGFGEEIEHDPDDTDSSQGKLHLKSIVFSKTATAQTSEHYYNLC